MLALILPLLFAVLSIALVAGFLLLCVKALDSESERVLAGFRAGF